jgi:hypothetical protein
MAARVLAGASAVLTLLVGAVYLEVLASQDAAPAVWFLALLLAAGTAAVVGATVRDHRAQRRALIVASVLLLGAALISLASLGLLLVPAVALSLLGLTQIRSTG